MNITEKIQTDSLIRAKTYFEANNHDVKTNRKDERVELVFETLVQVIESTFEPKGSYQVYYAIRSRENLGLPHYEIMLQYSADGAAIR